MRRICFVLFLALGLAAAAQDCPNVKLQQAAVMPGPVCNMSVVDGRLYCYSSGLLLAAQATAGMVYSIEGDTAFSRYADGMDYVVRQPGTNLIYFTVNKKGKSVLHYLQPREGKDPKVKKVKLPGLRTSVCHPSFSVDGRVMVYATATTLHGEPSQLWYSYQDLSGDWSAPRMLGIAGTGSNNEASPVVWGNFIYYASRDSLTSWHLRAVRVTNSFGNDGSLVEPALTCSAPYDLPVPFNSDLADFDFAIDTINGRCFVLSRRDGGVRLYMYNKPLPVVSYNGRVFDISGLPLNDVDVTVFCDGQQFCRTRSDYKGCFQLVLPATPSRAVPLTIAPVQPSAQHAKTVNYSLWLSKDGYFGNTVDFSAVQQDENHAITLLQNEVYLDKLELDNTLYVSDLFGNSAEYELTPQGCQKLQRVIRFLYENPKIQMSVTLSSNILGDNEFNGMVTSMRLQSLKHYLDAQLPSTHVVYENAHVSASKVERGSYNSRLAIRLTMK